LYSGNAAAKNMAFTNFVSPIASSCGLNGERAINRSKYGLFRARTRLSIEPNVELTSLPDCPLGRSRFALRALSLRSVAASEKLPAFISGRADSAVIGTPPVSNGSCCRA
jgi:hypothetical protein